MNIKKFFVAGIAGSAVMFVLAFLSHVVEPDSFEAAHYFYKADNMAYVVIGFLLIGFLLSFIYPHGYKGKSPLLEGYRFGMLMGALWAVPMAFIFFLGAGLATPIGTLVFVIFSVPIQGGLAGLVIGLIYGKKAFLPQK